ncbi:8100_t:CDS:2 [Paraglomus occultum]|uniref:8100_t:CDS:1 n=1 Tax=Paraglomus occultum TaxID=144539 RepID=A0A9N8W1D9_9GLOM|nr:8100_t:CDS:2 [Paraglomus occultum]
MSSAQEPEEPIKYLEISSKYIKHYPDENLIDKDIIARGGFGCSGNILVHMGTAKLADFGCSSELTAMMPTSNHVGKTAYMDPKITDRAYKRGKKSDIYSLGILLWEIASGERPYKDVEQEMIMFYVMQGNRPESALERPKEYVSLYSQCWDGDPDKRPDCEEVYERLESINKQAQEQAQLHQEPSNETSIKQTDQTVKKIELRGHELAIQIMKLHDDESTKGVNADKVIEKIRDWLIQNKYEKEDIFNQLKSHKDCGVCMFLVAANANGSDALVNATNLELA